MVKGGCNFTICHKYLLSPFLHKVVSSETQPLFEAESPSRCQSLRPHRSLQHFKNGKSGFSALEKGSFITMKELQLIQCHTAPDGQRKDTQAFGDLVKHVPSIPKPLDPECASFRGLT